MGLFTKDEKGQGAIKQGLREARGYIGAPGTTMGIGAFADPRIGQGQDFLGGSLQQAIMGQGMSPAQLMMQQGLGQAQSGMLGMAAGASPANSAAAMRGAMMQGGDMGAQVMQQMGILRAQEQEAARQQFLNLLGQQQQGMLGLEGLAAGNYGTAMGRPRQQQQTDLGAGLSAAGGMLGGVGSIFGGLGKLAGGGGGGAGG